MKMKVMKLEAVGEKTAKITGIVDFVHSSNLPRCFDNVEIKTGREGVACPPINEDKRNLRIAVQLLTRTLNKFSENPKELENTINLFLREIVRNGK